MKDKYHIHITLLHTKAYRTLNSKLYLEIKHNVT